MPHTGKYTSYHLKIDLTKKPHNHALLRSRLFPFHYADISHSIDADPIVCYCAYPCADIYPIAVSGTVIDRQKIISKNAETIC